jgi:hypothetical protein
MQKKLLNFSLLSLGIILTLYSCIRVRDSNSEGLTDSDKKYLIKLDRQFRNDSLNKIEYFVKKSDFLCQRREYKLAFNFCQGLDSLDTGYFKYPVEKKIMLNNLHILEYNKEGEIRKRDSLNRYMVNFFNDEQYKLHGKGVELGLYSDFLSNKRIQMSRMLWSYERINTDINGSIKNKGK